MSVLVDTRDIFCSVRTIKRGSGVLVNAEERDSTRRQQHSIARDNMISALLGPLLNTTRCSRDHCAWRERRHRGKTSRFLRHMDLSFLLICVKKLTIDSSFNVRASVALKRLSPLVSPGELILQLISIVFVQLNN